MHLVDWYSFFGALCGWWFWTIRKKNWAWNEQIPASLLVSLIIGFVVGIMK